MTGFLGFLLDDQIYGAALDHAKTMQRLLAYYGVARHNKSKAAAWFSRDRGPRRKSGHQ